jgi:hypothetical protein
VGVGAATALVVARATTVKVRPRSFMSKSSIDSREIGIEKLVKWRIRIDRFEEKDEQDSRGGGEKPFYIHLTTSIQTNRPFAPSPMYLQLLMNQQYVIKHQVCTYVRRSVAL